MLVTSPAVSRASAGFVRVGRAHAILNCNIATLLQKTLLLRPHDCAVLLGVSAVDDHVCELLLRHLAFPCILPCFPVVLYSTRISAARRLGKY